MSGSHYGDQDRLKHSNLSGFQWIPPSEDWFLRPKVREDMAENFNYGRMYARNNTYEDIFLCVRPREHTSAPLITFTELFKCGYCLSELAGKLMRHCVDI